MSETAASVLGARIRAVAEAPSENFRDLLLRAGLDPCTDLRFHNWSDLSLAGEDLEGMDFSGARLVNCDFSGSALAGACFLRAVIGQAGDEWRTRTNLRAGHGWRSAPISDDTASDGHLRAGMIFQDAPFAPSMVVIPAGRFVVRQSRCDELTAARERGREVTVARMFAVSEFAITGGEFAFYRQPRRPSRTKDHPLDCATWHDAAAYTRWLTAATRRPYRLLTETEWEYCCRAGRERPPVDSDEMQHCSGHAGSFEANAFGLRGMAKIGAEWCADVWQASYDAAPGDSSALVETAVSWFRAAWPDRRVVRGWRRTVRGEHRIDASTARDWAYPSMRGPRFRVATSIEAV